MDITASNCTTSRTKNDKEFTIKSPTACDIIRAGRLCKQLIIFFTLFDEHPTRVANLLAFSGDGQPFISFAITSDKHVWMFFQTSTVFSVSVIKKK